LESHSIITMATRSVSNERLETPKDPAPSIPGSFEMLKTPNGQSSKAHLEQQPMASAVLSHSLWPSDTDNPMNWPLYRKVYVSSCGFLFAASV
jgi:hypothetical protein